MAKSRPLTPSWLAGAFRHINGVYTQAFNRRHAKVGHLLQGRFKAILVDREANLLKVCRYVELNSVRAAMVATLADWPWSSHRANVGQAPGAPWLGTQELWGYLLGHDVALALDQARAQRLYAELVTEGQGVALWQEGLNRQIYLGDDQFVGRMLEAALPSSERSATVPKVQRSSTKTLAQWLAQCGSRDEALRRAHAESGLTMAAMAAELGITPARVGQLIARSERMVQVGEEGKGG